MMMSFNFIDHESVERPLWVRYVISLVHGAAALLLIMVMLTLLIGYQLLQKWLIMQNILADSTASLLLFSVGRWVILVFITLLIISIIYYIAPSRKRTIGFFSAGSVLATVLFFAAGWAFQAYLRVFNNYNILYGSIGTLLMVMLWVFAICRSSWWATASTWPWPTAAATRIYLKMPNIKEMEINTERLAIGLRCEQSETVCDRLTAQQCGSWLLAVYATPALVALMEKTAIANLAALLPAGTTTVGTHMDVRHLKASPVGAVVRCVST